VPYNPNLKRRDNCKCGKPVEDTQYLLYALFGTPKSPQCVGCYDSEKAKSDPPIKVFVMKPDMDLGELRDTIQMFVGD